MRVLVIRDELTEPPTWFLSYRDLTLFCSVFIRVDIVIESDDPTMYYRWMKPRGGMDFIEDFVRPGSQSGVFLDRCHRNGRPGRTIITDRIAIENMHNLIRSIRSAV